VLITATCVSTENQSVQRTGWIVAVRNELTVQWLSIVDSYRRLTSVATCC